MAYQPELGTPWFEFLGWPVYHPYAFFWWWFSYYAYASEIFDTGGLIAVSGGFAAIVVAIGVSVWRARELKTAETYGSARWADRRQIRKTGLLDDKEVVLRQFNSQYLRHDGPEHVLCFAPTRSGKGVGLVIPTLLTWPGSAIVHDIKDENWTLTSGYRSSFSRVLPFDPKRSFEFTLTALMITPHLGKDGVHPVVASAARELLNKSDNERSGVLSTAMSFLGLYRDPVVAKVTRHCDWRIADLVDGQNSATLYFVIPPSDISRTKPLIRLMHNQISRRLT